MVVGAYMIQLVGSLNKLAQIHEEIFHSFIKAYQSKGGSKTVSLYLLVLSFRFKIEAPLCFQWSSSLCSVADTVALESSSKKGGRLQYSVVSSSNDLQVVRSQKQQSAVQYSLVQSSLEQTWKKGSNGSTLEKYGQFLFLQKVPKVKHLKCNKTACIVITMHKKKFKKLHVCKALSSIF